MRQSLSKNVRPSGIAQECEEVIVPVKYLDDLKVALRRSRSIPIHRAFRRLIYSSVPLPEWKRIKR
jgi:hypothetical protein